MLDCIFIALTTACLLAGAQRQLVKHGMVVSSKAESRINDVCELLGQLRLLVALIREVVG